MLRHSTLVVALAAILSLAGFAAAGEPATQQKPYQLKTSAQQPTQCSLAQKLMLADKFMSPAQQSPVQGKPMQTSTPMAPISTPMAPEPTSTPPPAHTHAH
jgi:hypothetical protein